MINNNIIASIINTQFKSTIENTIEKYLGVKTNIVATHLASSIIISDNSKNCNSIFKSNKIFNSIFKNASLCGEAEFDELSQNIIINLRLLTTCKKHSPHSPTVYNLGKISINKITGKSVFYH